ncbi:hypothetical protein KY285_037959 [Solanum tuberosum]|nr:hypothetical protein KY285_037959 [Solanum tuberosum]
MRVAGMAREPPVEPHRPPDQHPSERHDNGNNPQLSTLHYTSHSSSKSPELQHSKKSLDSTVPIDSNREAISVRIATESPELRRQVHATFDQIQADSTTGDYFPHDGVHPTEISVQMDGGIVSGENSGEKRTQIAGVHESSGNNVHEGTSRKMHNTERSNSLPTSPAEINIQPAANHQLGARTSHEAEKAMQENGLDEQQANDQATMILNSENSSDEAHSSNFPFAANDKPTEDNGQVQRQRKDQPGPLKQSTGKELQTGIAAAKINSQSLVANTEAQSHNVRNEHISRTVDESKQSNFPKISNNFTRYVSNPQRNRDDDSNVNNDIAQNNGKQLHGQQQSQDQNNNKTDRTPEPAPFTIVQSFASRLRYNQSKNEIPIVSDAPIHTVRQGLPAVLFEETDYSIKLAEFCKHTLVGKLTNTMPKMELIRRNFTLQTQLTGGVKISHYNSRHVYIDLDNEFDYGTVWTKQNMSIECQIMRIQAWTPEFTPEEETPIVPIWVALPELPWHCYNKVLLSTLLESIGKVLYLDSPTSQRTRGSMAKVRVQVDLTKTRLPHIWMGFKNSDPNKGRWQKIQYEGIPNYCMYCKHQGHMDNLCTIKRRDEEFKRRKEMETEKQNKTKSVQNNGITETGTRQQDHQRIVQEKDYRDGEVQRQNQVQQQHTNQQQETKKGLQNHHEQTVDQEEQRQVQKRKQTKNQEQTPPKTAWRPVSTQDKTTKSSMQQAPSTAGILSNIPTNNNYTNLVMQEQPNKGIAGDNTNKGKSAQEVQTIEVCGGMDGGCLEKPTNLQERVTKGGSLTHVLHEVVHTDHRIDLRASATPISVQNSQNVQENVNKNHKGQIADTGQVQKKPVDPTNQGTEVQNRSTEQIQNTADPPGKGTIGNLQDQNEAQKKTPNNKSQGKISKKKMNAIKIRQEAEAARQGIKEGTTHKSHPQGQTHKSADNDEYNAVPSEDEFDQDTQSLGENNNEEDETSIHLIKAFGSTLQQEELQEVTDQQGLSPRGRLNSKQANNNTSANSSRPNTRSRSRGF